MYQVNIGFYTKFGFVMVDLFEKNYFLKGTMLDGPTRTMAKLFPSMAPF